jgi:hypothetical protein
MLAAATSLIAGVLDHTREEAYLAAIAAGKYQPERIRFHPALLWKAQNVAQYLAQSKKSS